MQSPFEVALRPSIRSSFPNDAIPHPPSAEVAARSINDESHALDSMGFGGEAIHEEYTERLSGGQVASSTPTATIFDAFAWGLLEDFLLLELYRPPEKRDSRGALCIL